MAASPIKSISRWQPIILRYFGGAQGTPGLAGCAAVFFDAESGAELWSDHRGLGVATSDVAEFRGLLLGLTAALVNNLNLIQVEGCSDRAIRQMQGMQQISCPHIQSLCDQVCKILKQFQPCNVVLISRESNKRADYLAWKAANGDSRAVDKPTTAQRKSFDFSTPSASQSAKLAELPNTSPGNKPDASGADAILPPIVKRTPSKTGPQQTRPLLAQCLSEIKRSLDPVGGIQQGLVTRSDAQPVLSASTADFKPCVKLTSHEVLAKFEQIAAAGEKPRRSFEREGSKLEQIGAGGEKPRRSFEREGSKLEQIGAAGEKPRRSFERESSKLEQIGAAGEKLRRSFEREGSKLEQIGAAGEKSRLSDVTPPPGRLGRMSFERESSELTRRPQAYCPINPSYSSKFNQEDPSSQQLTATGVGLLQAVNTLRLQAEPEADTAAEVLR